MSTRCNILITQDNEIKYYLYHHHDGYPEGVGKDLLDFFQKNNYIEVEEIVNELIKRQDDTEYELTSDIHGDIEYLYEVVLNNERLIQVNIFETLDFEPSKRIPLTYEYINRIDD